LPSRHPGWSLGAVPVESATRLVAATPAGLVGLRVAMVNWRDPWQQVAGGAEEYAWQIGRRLRDLGADVAFVTSRESGQARRETRERITLHRMGGIFTRYPRVLCWLLIRRRRFDAVIDCMNGIPFFTPLVLPRRTTVICVVHHVHDQQFFIHFPAWLATIGKILEGPVARRIYRRRAVVAVSPSTMTAMRERLRWTGPIFIVPNGSPQGATDTAPAADAADAGDAAAAGDPAIVCVGRLSAHKRVERVVDIADQLRDRWPNLKVHIVGRGAAAGPLAERIRDKGLEDHVRLHGYLSRSAKNALLAGAWLHVSASQFEGWGLSVIEAATLGVPTVAYDVDGLRDAVRDDLTGWLAAEDEPLADAVDRALKELSHPARRAEMRAACRQWAGRFTWPDSGDRMAELLLAERAAMHGPRRPRRFLRARGARRTGPYVVRFTEGAAERVALVENTDPVRLRAALPAAAELIELRPATTAELLLGRPGADLGADSGAGP
jgi:glycosyltransferase involved in cell wall biosynthesis